MEKQDQKDPINPYEDAVMRQMVREWIEYEDSLCVCQWPENKKIDWTHGMGWRLPECECGGVSVVNVKLVDTGAVIVETDNNGTLHVRVMNDYKYFLSNVAKDHFKSELHKVVGEYGAIKHSNLDESKQLTMSVNALIQEYKELGWIKRS